MIQVHRFMPDALAEILRKAPLNDEKIAFAWRAAVGAAMDRGTTVLLDRGVLRVRVKDPAWRREVERSEILIRARINAVLGRGTVRAIDVAVDHAAK
jgi:Dna[CI] antecedent DciA-like protein